MSANITSIQARLKNYSKQQKRTHTHTLIRYFQERLLYRLSKSMYKENFILKGGALMYAIQKNETRPTLDVDLLAMQVQSDEKKLSRIFNEICTLEYDDGVVFDTDELRTSEIIKEGNYSGIRVKVLARLGNIKQSLQIDIGFGDLITPAPIAMIYPTLLNMDAPTLLVYSTETLIAEKFHAMIDLSEGNSRMKDFYDVFTILNSEDYDKQNLYEAIKNTFKKRMTLFTENHALFTDDFYENEKRNQQWTAFLHKAKLNNEASFKEVMTIISDRLKPIYEQLT